MRGLRFSVAVVAVVSLLLTLTGVAWGDDAILEPLVPAPTAEPGEPADETPDLWFVQLRSPPAIEGTSLQTLRSEKDAFRAAASAAGVAFTERFAFDTLWNGLSIRINRADLGKLSRISGVTGLWPVATVAAPETTPVDDPELATALAMTGADVAQSELGLSGAGVRVAVMDTGIDYNHPDLGGCFGPGCRVETGYDFVGDAFNASLGTPEDPDPDPMDCNGHGTHVAGIIGADGAVTGVAPEVTFGAYKVFGCAGSTFADIMIAAMERALADGMQVLNMSIGSAFQWPNYPTAQASDRLVNAGVVVVASIGNSGANGVYSAGAPGVGSKVIGVASFDNSHLNVLSFVVNPSGQQVGYLPLSTTPDPPTGGTTPDVVYVGRGCNVDPYLADPNGKVALIVRGACTFNEKYQRAAAAGAVGVIIHNNVPGLFAGGGVVSAGIFGVGISLADGQHIRSLLDAGESVTITWTDQRINTPNPTGGLISSFSSYGLSPDLALKPDIGAPGGLIRSTYPLAKGGYAILSGTSMSSPHVAGAVALLLEARPNTPSQAVRGILQNTATPRVWWGNPGLGFLDNVHRQGAGMVNIPAAVTSSVKVEPGKLSLGESEAGPATRTLTVENKGASDVTLTLSHVPALSTHALPPRSTFSPGFATGFASVAFGAPSVTVPAGGTATVDVTITANPSLPDRSQYGGYIVLTDAATGRAYRVPYAGFKGDYQSIPVLNPAASEWGNPLLRATPTLGPTEPATVDPVTGELAWIWFHLDHQVRRLRFEVFDANTGRAWGRAMEFQYVGRNSGANTFFLLAWDGVTTHGNRTVEVPSGQYVIVLSVQKALGDDDNLAHWETWTSPVITVERP